MKINKRKNKKKTTTTTTATGKQYIITLYNSNDHCILFHGDKIYFMVTLIIFIEFYWKLRFCSKPKLEYINRRFMKIKNRKAIRNQHTLLLVTTRYDNTDNNV